MFWYLHYMVVIVPVVPFVIAKCLLIYLKKLLLSTSLVAK